jgi:hypothetical protein
MSFRLCRFLADRLLDCFGRLALKELMPDAVQGNEEHFPYLATSCNIDLSSAGSEKDDWT